MRSLLFVLLALSCAGAPPRESQIVLLVATDAPLPAAPGDAAPALFNRLKVEVLRPDTDAPCAGCVESFALNRAAVDSGRASFGVAIPAGKEGMRTRLTLYPSRGLPPRQSSSIMHTAVLPSLKEGELLRGSVVLRVSDVGAADVPSPLDAGEAPLLPIWPDAAPRACPLPPSPDEVCVAGRAFWMGDPSLEVLADPDEGGRVEHLVRVNPFFLDRAEVTVARFRAAQLAQKDELGRRYDPSDDLGPGTQCTYRDAPSANDALPVTCLSHGLAARFCESLGKRLPTEAELALAEGGLRWNAYVWGNDPPTCDDAVFARASGGRCSASGEGPRPPGSAARDRLLFDDSAPVVDLAANVSEWVQDLWNRDDEPCFEPGVRVNPRCTTPSPGDGLAWLARGGNWQGDAVTARAAVRLRIAYDRGATLAVSDVLGFRCARSI